MRVSLAGDAETRASGAHSLTEPLGGIPQEPLGAAPQEPLQEPDAQAKVETLPGMVVLGHVSGGYGLKGWVRVVSHTVPSDNILHFERWFLARGRRAATALKVLKSRAHGRGFVALLEGCEDREGADALRGMAISVPESDLPELASGEYYWSQLCGLEVWTRGAEGEASATCLGRIERLFETGANDVMVVVPEAGSVDDRERLIPYIRDHVVTRVDVEGGRVWVAWEQHF